MLHLHREGGKGRKRSIRGKSILSIPKRAPATATSMRGRMRANGRGRKTRVRNQNLIMAKPRNQSRSGWSKRSGNL
jgi:hypothetical protein